MNHPLFSMKEHLSHYISLAAPMAWECHTLQTSSARMLHAFDRKSNPNPWSVMQWESVLAHEEGFVMESGPTLLGMSVFHRVCDEAELLRLAIVPHYQGCGLGRALLKHTLDHLQACKTAYLFLEVRRSNTRALALYASLGGKIYGRRRGYYHDHVGHCEDALCVSFRLTAVS